MSKFTDEFRKYKSDCVRTSTAASSSALVNWQPSPPNPSKQPQVARQVEVVMSARHSVAFNAAPEVEEMYSHTPRSPPPQSLGQALGGETQIGLADAGVGSGQLLKRQSESTRHLEPEGQGVQEGPPQSTSVSRPFCKECVESEIGVAAGTK